MDTPTTPIYWKNNETGKFFEVTEDKDESNNGTGKFSGFEVDNAGSQVTNGEKITGEDNSSGTYSVAQMVENVLTVSGSGGSRRRRRKTAKKMSKRKLKKWCKSKKNCRSAKGRKLCKK